MRFLRRIAGFLGFRVNGHEVRDDEDEDRADNNNNNPLPDLDRSAFQETGLPRKGFGVQVQVAVDRPHTGPAIVPCASGDGGVQGLGWYAKRLRIDEDGDVADEFLDEVSSHASATLEEQHTPYQKFEVRYSTKPAKVKKQVMTPDGKIQQCVEYQGRLQWL